MSRRMLRVRWITIGSTLALVAIASLIVGLLVLHGDRFGESFVMLAKVLFVFSAASFVVLALSERKRRAGAPEGVAVAPQPNGTRKVSKFSRYIRGIFQGFAACVLLIVGLVTLARGNKAGIIVIAIGVVFGVAALTQFFLAERASREAATARSAE